MPRARLLKPGFFKNEELAGLDFETRLCYAGLWTIADREGRLADKPKRIKAEVFPYDDVDIDRILDQLASHGFIQRYVVDDEPYIAIPTFLRHQNPHVREPNSELPKPPKSTRRPASGEHSAGPVPTSDAHDAGTGSASGRPGGTGSGYRIRCTESVPDPESVADPEAEAEAVHPSVPLRGTSPLTGESPLRGSRRLKRNLDAGRRAVAHIQARGRR